MMGTRIFVIPVTWSETPIGLRVGSCIPPWAFGILLLAHPAAGYAQVLEGDIREEGTSAPVTGAFLVLLDVGGTQVAATLSDETGRFRLVAPQQGTYSVRLERLGYRSSVSSPVDLAAGRTTEYDWSVTVQAIELAAIRAVVESDRCEVRPSRVEELVVAWEEARKALSRVAWTAEEGLFSFQIQHHAREYDFETGRLVRQHRGAEAGVSRSSPFVGLPPAELVEGGFARFEADSVHYYGPDAGVLLSDPFLATHCFRLGLPREDNPDLIPLHFEPSRANRRPDIRGTIWLTAESGRLDAVDFVFTELPRWTEGRQASGRVEFEELPSGAWIVRRWWIRGPTLGGLEPPSTVPNQVLQRLPGEPVRVEMPTVLERGAEVVRYDAVGGAS